MIKDYQIRIKRCWPGVKNGQTMSVSARRRARLLALGVATDATDDAAESLPEEMVADPEAAQETPKRRGRPPKNKET